ncbi:MAG TPA: hypothetical protein VM096_04885 [Vicinamibacterales bacterium]|nr:hypothetical protein [Vicinamibacterales bacterium]
MRDSVTAPTREPVRRPYLRRLILLGLAIAVFTVACWPAARRVGVNHVVSTQQLPLWAKATDFVDRDANLASAARSILGGVSGEAAKADAALAWTRTNIRAVPNGFPIIDDHVWHIMVRGYGVDDQRADVFTTLLVYDGMPAYWMVIGEQPHTATLSYALVDGLWRVYDVSNGIVFKNAGGQLATPDEISGNHDLARLSATGVIADVDSYVAAFDDYTSPLAPDVLRAHLQMPGRRLWHETRRLFGRQGREWQMYAIPSRGTP